MNMDYDYGLKLLDNRFLVSEYKRMKEELDYHSKRMTGQTEGVFTLPSREAAISERRYMWLCDALPEMEALMRDRGLAIP